MKNVSRLSRASTSTAQETMKTALNKEESDSCLSVLVCVMWCGVVFFFLLKCLMRHSKWVDGTSAHKRCH